MTDAIQVETSMNQSARTCPSRIALVSRRAGYKSFAAGQVSSRSAVPQSNRQRSLESRKAVGIRNTLTFVTSMSESTTQASWSCNCSMSHLSYTMMKVRMQRATKRSEGFRLAASQISVMLSTLLAKDCMCSFVWLRAAWRQRSSW